MFEFIPLSYYAFSGLFNFITSFVLSIFVFSKNPRSRSNQTLSIFTLVVAGWSFFYFLWLTAEKSYLAEFYLRTLMLFVIFIPPTFAHFTLAVLKANISKKVILGNYLISLLLGCTVYTRLFVKEIAPYLVFPYWPRPGLFFYFHLIHLFVNIVYSSILMLRSLGHNSGIFRNQILYVFIGAVIGYISGITNYLPWFSIPIPPFINPLVSLYVASFSYAIIKYSLIDINIVFKKSFAYGLLIFTVFLPTYFVVIIVEKYFKGSISYPFTIVLLSLFILIAALFYKMKIKMDQVVEQTFFKERYNAYETLRDFTKAMVSILNLKKLGNRIVDTLARTMGVEKVSLLLYDEDKKYFSVISSCGLEQDKVEGMLLTWKDDFMPWLKNKAEVIVREELQMHLHSEELQKILEKMEMMESEVCIPFLIKNKLIGFCNLGRKINRGMFSTEDLNLLTTLAQQAAIVLENAKLYEEQKKAKILMRRADRLASLGTLAAGLAHEIRNPLTSIATFAELLPERKDDEEFMSSFCGIARSEAERIKILLTELLDYARPTAPKLEDSDINGVVESMVLFIGKEAEKKEVRVLAEFAEGLPKIMVDKHQIKQVFLNLLMNAIEAVPSGGEITIATRSFAPRGNMDFVRIEIRDTGVGIPEENLDRIFDPFFTTKHDSDTHVGTGLGLAIAHQIVQEHRGSIDVESRIGKGTTFYVNLPINPLLYERRRKKEEGEEG